MNLVSGQQLDLDAAADLLVEKMSQKQDGVLSDLHGYVVSSLKRRSR